MAIKVSINPLLRQYTYGQSVVQVDGSTVGQCLNDLVQKFPEIKAALFDKKGALFGYVHIYVNQETFLTEELAKPVRDGDKLHIIPMLGGG